MYWQYTHPQAPPTSPRTVLQFLLDLSGRQAAEAVRCRIDFKYAIVRHEALVRREAQ
ncbi:hypothetical protein [Streptomyces shenzhenensis]|uniref:hypothetical protein n=1 Tax=Streptomyces shenzhenensis TaxID=943815 RepID=UPI0033D1E78A